MSDQSTVGRTSAGPLRWVSPDRLSCLARHWAWADEALARFERELAGGLEYDEDLATDHPFGSYYHWCALLCGLTDAALDQQLLSEVEIDEIRTDLEACLHGLRACRRLLLIVPQSPEEQPLIRALTADNVGLQRLRRVHEAFGVALRAERMAREVDALAR